MARSAPTCSVVRIITTLVCVHVSLQFWGYCDGCSEPKAKEEVNEYWKAKLAAFVANWR